VPGERQTLSQPVMCNRGINVPRRRTGLHTVTAASPALNVNTHMTDLAFVEEKK